VLTNRFVVHDYNLAATLTSGQAFRWRQVGEHWEGVIHGRWVRLQQVSRANDEQRGMEAPGLSDSLNTFPGSADCQSAIQQTTSLRYTAEADDSLTSVIEATAAEPHTDWDWLAGYLRTGEDHAATLASFPDDEPMRAATSHCRGLRLLRQEPWECFASFILSSTKQIVQIQQCVALLCQHYGERIPSGTEGELHFTFPTPARIAAASEAELRLCKMGFRAKYLLDAARRVSSGQLDLSALPRLTLEEARAALMACHGVGRKIADCVLLFSLGFDEAFPIDVWVERALQRLYFPKRRAKKARLERFAATHFGPHAGLAQQYLFHYLRTQKRS